MIKCVSSNGLKDEAKRLAAFSLIGAALLGARSVPATTYYWDNNGDADGFGTAAGTWSSPTTGDATQGWSADATGATLPTNLTTTTSDSVSFGTVTVALSGGAITVSGTVSANTLTVGSASGAIILSGGSTYTGTTKVDDGTLKLGRNSAISSSSNMTLSGGTLEMGSFTNSLGTLTLAGRATLALGKGELSFKESKAILGSNEWPAECTV